jgi:UrcA family protein
MTHVSNACLLALASAATLAFAAPAAAQTSDAPTRIVVRYSDLDLGAPAGARVLMQRIRTAAATACGEAPDIRALDQHAQFAACRDGAVDAAVDRLASPMVSAVARGSATPSLVARR